MSLSVTDLFLPTFNILRNLDKILRKKRRINPRNLMSLGLVKNGQNRPYVFNEWSLMCFNFTFGN